MEFTALERSGQWILTVSGHLDGIGAARVRRYLAEYMRRGCRSFQIDLSQVLSVDTAALAVLVGATKDLEQCGGSLELSALTARLHRIVRDSYLDRVLNLAGVNDDSDANGANGASNANGTNNRQVA